MSIDRKIWDQWYTINQIPEYVCPKCRKGKLLPIGEPKSIEPEFSKALHSHEAHDFEWIETRLSLPMKCSSNRCGEIATLYAIGSVERDQTDYNDFEMVEYLKTKMIFPSPWLFDISEGTSREVTEQIVVSFNAYWVDPRLSANALRTSLELLLDELSVPRNGSLSNRVDLLAEKDPEHAKIIHALRHIGNLGSHGEAVSNKALFDAFEVYEYFLDKLYDTKEAKFLALRENLLETKGKY